MRYSYILKYHNDLLEKEVTKFKNKNKDAYVT